MTELPARGPAVHSLDLPLPPRPMPLLRDRRPLKRWRYVGVFGPDLMLCLGDARIAGMRQRWWAVALPDGSLHEGRGGGPISLELDEGDGVEVVSPHGRSFIWTRKQAGIGVRGQVLVGDREWRLDGPLGFVDDSAGYHARHTVWRWSAGIGRARSGSRVAWNLVEGVHDAQRSSERTLWVDGEPHEVPPQPFLADLSGVGELRFDAWCTRAERVNRLLVRNDYRQPFGSFSGTLPGGLELESGYGVMEWHDVWW